MSLLLAQEKLDAALVRSGEFGHGDRARVWFGYDDRPTQYPACKYDITSVADVPERERPGDETANVQFTLQIMTEGGGKDALRIADAVHQQLLFDGIMDARTSIFLVVEDYTAQQASRSGGLYRLGIVYAIDPDGEPQDVDDY